MQHLVCSPCCFLWLEQRDSARGYAARARYGAYGPLRPMLAKAFHALRTMGPFRVRIPELGTTWLDAEEGGR